MMDLTTYRRSVNIGLESYRQASLSAQKEQDEADRIGSALTYMVEAQQVVQQVAQAIQQRAHERISSVVSRCLNAVFDDAYEFKIVFERKRGKTEARLTFIREGMALDDPMDEVGGGVIDVAALALRLACILLTRPAARRLLVLDEPWKAIRGEQNKQRTRDMLLRLTKELGLQVIINTDIENYRLGSVIELE